MRRFVGDPYKNFVLAIIERAVKDCKRKYKLLEKGKNWNHELLNDPEYYLFESTSEEYPSFLSICAILSYPPGKLRKEIRAYLGVETATGGLSNLERAKIKVRDAGIIQRYMMTRYASDSLKINSKELNKVMDTLEELGYIRKEKRLTNKERWATFYLWRK